MIKKFKVKRIKFRKESKTDMTVKIVSSVKINLQNYDKCELTYKKNNAKAE